MRLKEIDLRPICRNADKFKCRVNVWQKGYEQIWLTLGDVNITENHDVWELVARTPHATDFEHNSVYACSLPLIGLKLSYVSYPFIVLNAWINPDEDHSFNFCVPPTGYNPMKHKDTKLCELEGCEKHPIVSEEFFTPPFDKTLFEEVRGKKVSIRIGPAI